MKHTTDTERIDWLEDNPRLAVRIMEAEHKAMLYGHMLRQRIDEAMKEEIEK